MKLIKYNNGAVCFKLPLHWKEEYYDNGGAAFYRDDEDSGTLRLNITPSTIKSDDWSVVITTDTDAHVQESFPLKEQVKYISEDGENFLIYYWDIVVPVENGNRRIVSFSYSVLVSQERDPVILEELSFVRNTIIKAHYSQKEDI